MRAPVFLVASFAFILSMGCIQYHPVVVEPDASIYEPIPEAQLDPKNDVQKAEVSPAPDFRTAEPLPRAAATPAPPKAAVKKQLPSAKTAPKGKKARVGSTAICTKDRVVVTCPPALDHLVVERFDGGVVTRFVVKPGTGVAIYTRTLCLDTPLVLVAHGYKKTNDGKDVYVGRASQRLRGFEFLLAGHTIFWEVSLRELSQ